MNDDEIVKDLMQELGKSCIHFGYPPIIGEVWATLFIKGSKTQDQLKEELNTSISGISQSLNALQSIGIISVIGKDGRKNIYAAEQSFEKTKRKKAENALHFVIEPMINLIDTKSKFIKDKNTKERLNELRKMYGKMKMIIKMVLTFSPKEK